MNSSSFVTVDLLVDNAVHKFLQTCFYIVMNVEWIYLDKPSKHHKFFTASYLYGEVIMLG